MSDVKSLILAERLDAYSAASKNIASRSWTKWEKYAAAMGSALALTTGASAGIISGSLTGVSISVGEVGSNFGNTANKTFQLGAGGPVFNIHLQNHRNVSSSSGFTYVNRGAQARLSGPGVAFTAYGSSSFFTHAKNFASGQVISVGSAFRTNAKLHSNGSTGFNPPGNFPQNGAGFAGVRFSNSTGAHPGWIKLSLSDQNSDGYIDHLSALSYGYETSGNTIVAGAPEPGTMALSLLALGSVAVMGFRRRKQESAEVKATE